MRKTVGRDGAQPPAAKGGHVPAREIGAVDGDPAAGGRPQPGQRVGKLLLPVAADAGDPVDLAAAHGEADTVHTDAPGSAHTQILDPEPHLAEWTGAALCRLALLPHHRPGQDLGIQTRGVGAGEHRFALAHHRYPRRVADHLAQLVGDEDHRVALFGEAAHEGERRDRFLVGQHGGGLVQDENPGAEEPHLEDLDTLLLGEGERIGRRRGRELVLVGGRTGAVGAGGGARFVPLANSRFSAWAALGNVRCLAVSVRLN